MIAIKHLTVFALLMAAISVVGQISSNNFYSANKKIVIKFKQNSFTIVQTPTKSEELSNEGTDNIYVGTIIFSSKDYYYKHDTLVVKNGKSVYKFKLINKEILYALSDIPKYIKAGTKFYCSYFELSKNETLYGGEWKNDKKHGRWIYVKNHIRYYFTYKEGKLIRTVKINI